MGASIYPTYCLAVSFSEEAAAGLRREQHHRWDAGLRAGVPAAHFGEEQIIELALVIATANWTTRINAGLQVPSD